MKINQLSFSKLARNLAVVAAVAGMAMWSVGCDKADEPEEVTPPAEETTTPPADETATPAPSDTTTPAANP